MKRCKYLDAHSVKWLRNPLRENGLVYCNPTQEVLNRLGYYPLADSPRGETRPGFVLTPHYRVEGTSIVRTWVEEEAKEEA